MVFKRIALAFAILAMAAGCPAFAGAIVVPIFVPVKAYMPTMAGDYSKVHTVAVVSAIGQTMTLGYGNFWGNNSKTLDIHDWKVDEGVEGLLRKYLSSRFAFKDVTFDRAAIETLPNGPLANTNGKVRKILSGLPNDGIDAFIVVRPDLESSAPGVEGLALQNGSNFGNTLLPVIWANYELDVIDSHTYQTIAKAYARIRIRTGAPTSFAGLIGSSKLALDDKLAITDEQRDLLHLYVEKLVTVSLTETIRSLSFGVSLPESGDRTLVPIPPDKKPFPSIKSIAVLSTLGTTFTLVHTGAMFAHDVYDLPIGNWEVDDLVEKTMAAHLDGRFTVKTVPVDRTALLQAHLVGSDGKISPAFPGLTVSQDVDAYLLALPMPFHCDPGLHECPGLGLLHFTPMGDNTTRVFAHYMLVLLDAHTLKPLSLSAGVMPPDHPVADPVQDMTDADWPEKPPTLDPQQTARVRDALNDALNDSLPEAMMRAGLTGMMVETTTLPSGSGSAPSASSQSTAP